MFVLKLMVGSQNFKWMSSVTLLGIHQRAIIVIEEGNQTAKAFRAAEA